MKASELRLGNWINCIGTIRKVSLSTIHELNISENEYIRPIPLNEEWLIKCGFELSEHKDQAFLKIKTDFTNGSSFSLDCFTDDWSFMIEERNFNDGNNCSFIPRKINYVHELQNLYFALTNEELI